MFYFETFRSILVVTQMTGRQAMAQDSRHMGNVVLLRGASLWLLVALVLAWCLVFMKADAAFIKVVFKDFDRLLQAHIDFLLMTALIFGFYAARVQLPWHVRWSMVVGAFTNSSIFLVQAISPMPGPTEPAAGEIAVILFQLFSLISVVITTYGFGMASILVFRSTFDKTESTY